MHPGSGTVLAASSSSNGDGAWGLFVFVGVAVVLGLVGVFEWRRRRRLVDSVLRAVTRDPGGWPVHVGGPMLAATLGPAVARRPTGPALYHVGGMNDRSEFLLAFDDEVLILRSVPGNGASMALRSSGMPPRYRRRGLFGLPSSLIVGHEAVIVGPIRGICNELVRLGWWVDGWTPTYERAPALAGGWPPPLPAPPTASAAGAGQAAVSPPSTVAPAGAVSTSTRYVPAVPTALVPTPRGIPPGAPRWRPGAPMTPTPPVRQVRQTPDGPVRPAAPVSHEIEYGVDSLGPAIDEWIGAGREHELE